MDKKRVGCKLWSETDSAMKGRRPVDENEIGWRDERKYRGIEGKKLGNENKK